MGEPVKKLFNRDEYCRLGAIGLLKPDERLELIEGEIYRLAPLGNRRASCLALLSDCFSTLSAQGRALLCSQRTVHLGDFSELHADLVIGASGSDLPPEAIHLLIQVADLYLEHERRKIPLYALNGISEVWLVDLSKQRIDIYRDPARDGYRTVQRFQPGDRIAPQAFPDFEVEVAALLP